MNTMVEEHNSGEDGEVILIEVIGGQLHGHLGHGDDHGAQGGGAEWGGTMIN